MSVEQTAVKLSPLRLNHAVLYVADLERAISFYTDLFDMTIIAREPSANAAFLRLTRSGNDHDLGLFGIGVAATPEPFRAVGLYHLAWQFDTIDELVGARQALQKSGAYTGESSHGATKSIYGVDPDGNEFELMWMLPRDQWRPFEGVAHLDPLNLDEEVRRWSQIQTGGRDQREIVTTTSQPAGQHAVIDKGRHIATTQLRRYQIEGGQMKAFLHYWHKLIEQRQKFGFRVVFAYVDDTNNELVWAVEHDGDFNAAESEYMHSAERAAALIGAPQVMKGVKIGLAIRVM